MSVMPADGLSVNPPGRMKNKVGRTAALDREDGS
jgi:hypothetical protein